MPLAWPWWIQLMPRKRTGYKKLQTTSSAQASSASIVKYNSSSVTTRKPWRSLLLSRLSIGRIWLSAMPKFWRNREAWKRLLQLWSATTSTKLLNTWKNARNIRMQRWSRPCKWPASSETSLIRSDRKKEWTSKSKEYHELKSSKTSNSRKTIHNLSGL